MPYRIRKQPNKNLYKVYSQSGKPLSKKGLTMKQAVKQRIAVSIAEAVKRR